MNSVMISQPSSVPGQQGHHAHAETEIQFAKPEELSEDEYLDADITTDDGESASEDVKDPSTSSVTMLQMDGGEEGEEQQGEGGGKVRES